MGRRGGASRYMGGVICPSIYLSFFYLVSIYLGLVRADSGLVCATRGLVHPGTEEHPASETLQRAFRGLVSVEQTVV